MGEGDGVSFQIYNPDRDLENEIYSIDDVQVVSMEQAILDLAGLGAMGADSAKVLAQKYSSE